MTVAALFAACTALRAQTASTHMFHDRAARVSFSYPANWTFAEQDHEISTFHLDVRTAPRKSRLRAVVAMPENPFPSSTFSGGYVYFSVTPHSSAAACARQAIPPRISEAEAAHRAAEARAPSRPYADSPDESADSPHAAAVTLAAKPERIEIAGVPFTRGRDEQREVCITQHDDVYTTWRAGACIRFDLAINNFCSGEASGARDITPVQLDMVRSRLMAILKTMYFDAK